jgi:lipopolysaccharide biosynthesis glycosyltransferase
LLKLHRIDVTVFSGLPEQGHLKLEAYYRLAIPDLIDANRVLYLDCDIIVNSDLSDLFKLDVDDFPLAAVKDPAFQPIRELGMREGASYFNSGVMLLNLKHWRTHRIAYNTLEYLRSNPEKIRYADQCALNAVVNGHYLEIDERFNWQTGHLFHSQIVTPQSISPPVIIHFTGSLKPTNYLCESPYKDIFINELSYTPYRWLVLVENAARYILVVFKLRWIVSVARRGFGKLKSTSALLKVFN